MLLLHHLLLTSQLLLCPPLVLLLLPQLLSVFPFQPFGLLMLTSLSSLSLLDEGLLLPLVLSEHSLLLLDVGGGRVEDGGS